MPWIKPKKQNKAVETIQFNVQTLQEKGVFCGPPVKRSIRWQEGDNTLEADVFVRPISYFVAVADAQILNFGGDATAQRIAASIVNEANKPVFTPGDITGEADPERGPFSASLTRALLVAIGEVSNLEKKKNRSVN